MLQLVYSVWVKLGACCGRLIAQNWIQKNSIKSAPNFKVHKIRKRINFFPIRKVWCIALWRWWAGVSTVKDGSLQQSSSFIMQRLIVVCNHACEHYTSRGRSSNWSPMAATLGAPLKTSQEDQIFTIFARTKTTLVHWWYAEAIHIGWNSPHPPQNGTAATWCHRGVVRATFASCVDSCPSVPFLSVCPRLILYGTWCYSHFEKN